MRVYIVFFMIAIFSVAARSQVTSFVAASDQLFIQTYGLEDATTITLIQKLTADTTNMVIVDNYGNFLLKALLDQLYIFRDGEDVLCSSRMDNLIALGNRTNLIGYNYSKKEMFPDFYFKLIDSIKFKELANKYGFSNIIESNISSVDSLKRIEICNDFSDKYFFSALDSLQLLRRSFGRLLTNDDLKSIGMDRKIIYLVSNYGRKNGINDFISLHQENKENVYFILAKKGSTETNINYFKFRNHVKKTKEMNEFDLMVKSQLPKKLRFSSRDIYSSKDLEGFNFLYVNELNNCVW